MLETSMKKTVAGLLLGSVLGLGMTVAYAHDHHNHGDMNHGHMNMAHHMALSPEAIAKLPDAEGVTTSDCWIRLLPKDVDSSAYFKLHNGGKKSIKLEGVYSENFGMAMLHNTIEEKGMYKMVALHDKTVKPGHDLEFKPKHKHVMLMHSKDQLKEGDTAKITLVFKGSKHVMECTVKGPNAL